MSNLKKFELSGRKLFYTARPASDWRNPRASCKARIHWHIDRSTPHVLSVVKLNKFTPSRSYLRPVLILSPHKYLNLPAGLFSAVLLPNFLSDFPRICRHINIWWNVQSMEHPQTALITLCSSDLLIKDEDNYVKLSPAVYWSQWPVRKHATMITQRAAFQTTGRLINLWNTLRWVSRDCDDTLIRILVYSDKWNYRTYLSSR